MPIPTADPAVIQRSTYSIGGQAVALRVVEKAVNGTELSNELYYFHTDHASALLSTGSGQHERDVQPQHRQHCGRQHGPLHPPSAIGARSRVPI